MDTQIDQPLQAAYLTHELRAPLTSINLTLEILREQLEKRLESDEKQLFSIAIKNSARLAGLINDIMDYAKISAGRVALKTRSVRPETLIEEAVSGLEAWALSARVRMFSSSGGKPLPEVRADSKRVMQILTNLLSNAIKFTPEGGEVEVSAVEGRFLHAGGVVFSVRDTGCGIPAKDRERIFNCFEQSTSGANARAGSGTGLGLTLAKAMVELHGGRIWLESAEGAGTTFFFSLPAERPAVQAESSRALALAGHLPVMPLLWRLAAVMGIVLWLAVPGALGEEPRDPRSPSAATGLLPECESSLLSLCDGLKNPGLRDLLRDPLGYRFKPRSSRIPQRLLKIAEMFIDDMQIAVLGNMRIKLHVSIE